MALRWIQDNISSFGGDRSQITIHGFGAGKIRHKYEKINEIQCQWHIGSVSAHMHVLSTQSRRIFQRAILVGGAAVNPWAITHESQVPRLMQFGN